MNCRLKIIRKHSSFQIKAAMTPKRLLLMTSCRLFCVWMYREDPLAGLYSESLQPNLGLMVVMEVRSVFLLSCTVPQRTDYKCCNPGFYQSQFIIKLWYMLSIHVPHSEGVWEARSSDKSQVLFKKDHLLWCDLLTAHLLFCYFNKHLMLLFLYFSLLTCLQINLINRKPTSK